MSAAWRLWLGALMVLMAGAVMAAGPLSPAGIAYLKAEQNRIDRQFVEQAASVAGVPPRVVANGMPQGPRITDTGQRVISAIEQYTSAPLSEQQRARIQAADDARKAALARAREAAVGR